MKIKNYNIRWDSQSKDCSESMPCGGHDLGMNIWVENDQIYFHMDRSGNFDENNQQLKSGRGRISIEPNPFKEFSDFRQELKLNEGYVEIELGKGDVFVKIWADVFQARINIDFTSKKKYILDFAYETWRFEDREVPLDKRHACLSYRGYQGQVFTYKDEIRTYDSKLMWFHKNQNDKLLRDKLIEQQKLSQYTDEICDTQSDRIFGACMSGDNLRYGGESTGKYFDTAYKSYSLKTKEATNHQSLKIDFHTAQSSLQSWEKELELKVNSEASSHAACINWWENFWKRSHICIGGDFEPDSEAWQVGRNYQLFRYMLGTNAYGEYPSKFNGALFTMDPRFGIGGYEDKFTQEVNYDLETPDFRQWGGGSFTSQNQRLVYWPMLKSGDFDMMPSQFNYFKRCLNTARARVKQYWGHGGACFAEQLENFGLPIGWGYGWEGDPDEYHQREEGLEDGVEGGMWVRYYYESQIEWSFMIIRYLIFCEENISEWMPFIKESIVFYDEHYRMRSKQSRCTEFNQKGEYVFAPTKPLETFKSSTNPLPIIVGLKTVLPELIKLAKTYPDLATEESRWKDMLSHLPAVPLNKVDGKEIFSPAERFDPEVINQEDPQLYGVFPYPYAKVGESEFDIAVNTWKYDPLKIHFKECWGQSEIWAVKLMQLEDSKDLIIHKLSDSGRRFPAFWGPGPDWVPDVDHGGAGMIGLQEMILQSDDDRLLLLHTWPKEWDLDCKLHAPKKTIVEIVLKDGVLEKLSVSPKERAKDVVIAEIYREKTVSC